MKSFFILCLFLGLASASLSAQTNENAAVAFELAKKNNKKVLLVFSGSDWCQACIRFKKEVIDDLDFNKFARNKLIVLNADFPQNKKQEESTINQNAALAEKYNPRGYFPKIVLLNPDQTAISSLAYTKQTAPEFVFQIQQIIPDTAFKAYKKRIQAMGSFFEFIIVDSPENEEHAWQMINQCIQEVDRIEQLISEWIDHSQISQVNKWAGIRAVQVSPELYGLIERSIQIGQLTQGAFDISFHALDGFWKFDGTQTRPPDSAGIKAALKKIGYQKIQLLDSSRVYLAEKGMSIGFGGIGQGYIVDKVKELLMENGIENFVVNSSGDVFAKGFNTDQFPWRVGVANPFNKNEIIRWLNVDERAVVTSGNYEKYFEFKGVRYAHIIDPRTGWPSRGIVSATVISPFTEVADALATAIFVLGVEVSLDLVNQLPGTHCIIIDDQKNVYYSRELIPKKE